MGEKKNRAAEPDLEKNRPGKEQQDPNASAEQGSSGGGGGISETWAEETIADLDDWIESQGIYIRQ